MEVGKCIFSVVQGKVSLDGNKLPLCVLEHVNTGKVTG